MPQCVTQAVKHAWIAGQVDEEYLGDLDLMMEQIQTQHLLFIRIDYGFTRCIQIFN